MASSSHCGHWEAPTFHFNPPNKSEDWSVFYTRALDYLDAFDIELEAADSPARAGSNSNSCLRVKIERPSRTL